MNEVRLLEEDKKMLLALGVEAVVLFGSRATGTESELSDFDFGILLNDMGYSMRRKNYHDYYTAVYDVLAERFGDLQGLDVVFLDRAPLELRNHVARYGKPVMEYREGMVMDFNAQTMLLYADFEPYRRMMNQAVLDNIE